MKSKIRPHAKLITDENHKDQIGVIYRKNKPPKPVWFGKQFIIRQIRHNKQEMLWWQELNARLDEAKNLDI